MVIALAVEHHSDGTVIPLMMISDAPGLLTWESGIGMEVVDDLGTAYNVHTVTQLGALGSLAVTVWLDPVIPTEAAWLRLSVHDIHRLSATRGRSSVERPLVGGPWELDIDLRPERTVAPAPPRPAPHVPLPPRPSRVPARAVGTLQGVIPVGQAKIRPHFTLGVWAVERYIDRAVMSVGLLVDPPHEAGHLFPDVGVVNVWDDLGNQYRATPIGGVTGPGWSESSVEVVPAPLPGVETLGIEIGEVPVLDSDGESVESEPILFGVAVGSAR